MTKRNFILLIIFLIIILVIGGLYLYGSRGTPEEGEGADLGGTNFIARFNPFRNSDTGGNDTGGTADTGEGSDDPEEEPLEPEKLQKVSSIGIAGYGIYKKERLKEVLPIQVELEGAASVSTKPTAPPTEFATAVRYVERSNGNIYETFTDKIEERKFSGTVIPKIYEAFLGNKSDAVLMRYLKTDERTIVTFLGNLPKEVLGGDTVANNEVKGTFLPENVTDVTLSPDGSKAFYLFNSSGSAIGTTINLVDGKKAQVFDSPFTEWLSFWPNANTITLTTKPSALVPGYMYSISPSKKGAVKVLGGINGLTTLMSPNGKLVLYSDSTLRLYIYHTDSRASDQLALRTMPEKCVWSKDSSALYCAVPKSLSTGYYPDSWYKGVASFNDQIWKIDIVTGSTNILVDPATSGGEVDGIKLSTDEMENYLFFVNKKDSFLWKLDLK